MPIYEVALMCAKMDITGQRFGRLVAVREVQTGGHNRCYLCHCDCGNEKIVRMDQLRNGKTKSCGCFNREMTAAKNTSDLTGQHFGRLTVLHRSNKHHKTQNHAIWTCRCDCGAIVDVLSKYLLEGNTKSCGCWKVDNGRRLRIYEEKKYRKNGVYIPALKCKVRRDSTTGVKGVTLIRENGKYRASLTLKGRRFYLGSYSALEDAKKARAAAEDKYYKPYLES